MSIFSRLMKPHVRWALLLGFTLLAAPANAAQVTIHPVETTEATARLDFLNPTFPGSSRSILDQDNIFNPPVPLPTVLTATATSAVSPDDADDTSQLMASLADTGFSLSSSMDVNETVGDVDVGAATIMNILFTVDQPVVYTISGSLSWAGDVNLAGWAILALTRISGDAALFSEAANGASSPLVVGLTGTGQLIGTLVAGQTYRFSADPTLLALTDGSAKSFTGNGTISISFVDAQDSDEDGVADDGDASGVVGDTPCVGGNQLLCDDNCAQLPNFDQADSDVDGIGDVCEVSPPAVPFMGTAGRILLVSCVTAIGGLLGSRRRRPIA